jgi:hypothetical protein
MMPRKPAQLAPRSPISEAPAWSGATRIIVLTSSDGVRQWRCEGLASNVTPEGLRILADLLELAEARRVASPFPAPALALG